MSFRPTEFLSCRSPRRALADGAEPDRSPRKGASPRTGATTGGDRRGAGVRARIRTAGFAILTAGLLAGPGLGQPYDPAADRHHRRHAHDESARPTGDAGAPGERVVELQIDRLNQRVLYAAPPNPVASIVMLPGGSGDLDETRNGDIRHHENFVVRTRAPVGGAWLCGSDPRHDRPREPARPAQFACLCPPRRWPRRLCPRQARGPVYLLGTSQGSIAAMNGAAHARPGAVAGVVLTESVSILGHSGETVFSAAPQDVRVPALVVANRQDRCDVAPPQEAPRIARGDDPVAEREGARSLGRDRPVREALRLAHAARLLRHRAHGHRGDRRLDAGPSLTGRRRGGRPPEPPSANLSCG